MRARSKTTGLTVKMPYTARVCRDGRLEFVCDWIKGSPTKGWRLKEAVDSPWFRLPKSILQVFTIGDSRADVWVFNSGLYVDDLALHHGPVDRNKGGANGSRWILLPLPHRPAAQAWTIEQAILSSFERIDMRVSAYPFVDFSRLIFNTDCRYLIMCSEDAISNLTFIIKQESSNSIQFLCSTQDAAVYRDRQRNSYCTVYRSRATHCVGCAHRDARLVAQPASRV